MQQQERKRSLVFISYSHDSQEHLERVFELCERLRKLGFDCRLDQHETFPSSGWPQWMLAQIQSAACVLVVCTRGYLETYRHGQDNDLWQGPVLPPEVFTRQETRFVPLLFDSTDAPFIPEPLQPFSHFHIADGRGLELLAVYLSEKLALGTGPLPAKELLPRRQPFTAPLPQQKPWRLPGPPTPHFCNRDRQRKQLEGQCRKACVSRITAAQSGLGRSQIVLQHAVKYGDSHSALIWLDWGNEALLRHELKVASKTLGFETQSNDLQTMAQGLKRWLDSHDKWLTVLRGWPTEAPLSQVLASRPPKGCMLFLPPPGSSDPDDATEMHVPPLPEKDFLALLRGRTGRRALMRPEREAALRLAEALHYTSTFLDMLGALAARDDLSFQQIDEEIGAAGDVPMALLLRCLQQSPLALRRLLCLMSIPGVPRVPEDILLTCIGQPLSQGMELLQQASRMALAGHFSRESAWFLNSGLAPLAMKLLPASERASLLQNMRSLLMGKTQESPGFTLHEAVLMAVDAEQESNFQPQRQRKSASATKASSLEIAASDSHAHDEALQHASALGGEELPESLTPSPAESDAAHGFENATSHDKSAPQKDEGVLQAEISGFEIAESQPPTAPLVVGAAQALASSPKAPATRPASRRGHVEQLPLAGVYPPDAGVVATKPAPRMESPATEPQDEALPEVPDTAGREPADPARVEPFENEAEASLEAQEQDQDSAKESRNEGTSQVESGDPAPFSTGQTEEADRSEEETAAPEAFAQSRKELQEEPASQTGAHHLEDASADKETPSPTEAAQADDAEAEATDKVTEQGDEGGGSPRQPQSDAQDNADMQEPKQTDEGAKSQDVLQAALDPKRASPAAEATEEAADVEFTIVEDAKELEKPATGSQGLESADSASAALTREHDSSPHEVIHEEPVQDAALNPEAQQSEDSHQTLGTDLADEQRFETAPSFGASQDHDVEDDFAPPVDSGLEEMREALGRAWGRRVILPALPTTNQHSLFGRVMHMIGRFFYQGRRRQQPSPRALPEASPASLPRKSAFSLNKVEEPEAETVVQRPRAPSVRPADSEPDLPATAAECEKRANAYIAKNRLREAEPFLARALQLLEKLHGPEHLESARAANALGELYRQLGELEQAEPLLERALNIRVSIWGDEHPEVAQSCTNLGSLRLAEGRTAEAEALYVRALRMDEALFGHEHPNTATDCNNLAVLYFRMERFAEALRNIKRAMTIREQILGEGHPLHRQACENCVAILRKLGRNREADEIIQRLRIACQEGPNEDPQDSSATMAAFREEEDYDAMTPDTKHSLDQTEESSVGIESEPQADSQKDKLD